MSPFIPRGRDAARVALAVDALCVGTDCPVLVHVSTEARASDDAAFGLVCTPLTGLRTLDTAITVLERFSSPTNWTVAGLCSPTSIRFSGGHRGAWFIHIVTRAGQRASRLCVPGEHELSGPVRGPRAGHRLDRCLGDLVGATRPHASDPAASDF